MRFRIWTILWVFALFASALAAFGNLGGCIVTLLVLLFWNKMLHVRASIVLYWLLFITVSSAIVALLFFSLPSAREASRRSMCGNNMRQIALALHNYHETHGSFPPAYQLGPDGKPWHSWRVHILPYIEGENLFDAYSFDEPWDGPNNRKLWDLMPEIFRCPGCTQAAALGMTVCNSNCTNYFAVVGSQTAWPGETGGALKEISDGASNTLLLVEANKPVCWLQPSDLSFEEALELLTTNKAPGHISVSPGFFADSIYSYGLNAICADGHLRHLDLNMKEKVASALLTSAGQEKLEQDGDWYKNSGQRSYYIGTIIHWSNIYSLTIFILLSLLPIFKVAPARKQRESIRNISND